ncbi:hypothetical protein UFOVP260_7 [uncultured Caudovirales phage]|uniref:Uncharacterized protein n=1 Tax=uncultured Caudovirales phage TaxID=2100421 RepID=A0A6J5RWP0_9CAUD|nr:hypothetical protein UFOVP85_55 [uncultured Caudovirales phage]CAB4132329.1 hypothetical protein UFOVP260_7 [uncultured Caudovirales phage]CAB4202852.1 hypothetical protein UFOVP1363_38 [uncultured Caudovirales phage]CAB5207071.1 hypothetical protein UFOVP179_12 [uncultured Caudovirales phage]
MNDFTKEDLQEIIDMTNDIHNGSQGHGLELHFKLRDKTQSMIDNYCDDRWSRRKIAESHLREAESLISHAMCLLEMNEE